MKTPRFAARTCFALACLAGVSPVAAIEQALPDLKPPHAEIQPSFWELYRWQLVFGGVGIALALALTIWWLSRPRSRVQEDPAATARRDLATLRGHAEDGATVARVSVIMRKYVRAVFGFPPGELTTMEFCRTLKSIPEINPEPGQSVGEFLRQCDEWKFALPVPLPQPGPTERAMELVDRVESTRSQAAKTQP